MKLFTTMSKSVTIIVVSILCHSLLATAEENDFGEDQIAMESSAPLSDSSQYRSYLPPPSDFKFQSIEADSEDGEDIEDLPTPAKWKSSSELRKSTSRTFKDGKPVVLIDKETGLPVDPEEKKKYLANPEEHQARNYYSYVNTNTGTLLFNTQNPYYYLNFTDTQQNTFAALGNAALFLGSLLVLGNLPASTLGLGRSDSSFDHRTGNLGRPPQDVLDLPPPRLTSPPINPLRKGIQSFQRGIKRVVGKKRRPSNQRQGSFGPKRPKRFQLPNPIAGVRRLRKKVGNALKEYTYRKRGSGRNNNLYRGDRRGQDVESSISSPSRHPHHRNYPLPLPPTQAVVTNSLRKRKRYNRNKQPVYFDDLADYGNDIYETGVVLEPIRPPVQNEPEYYDDDEYNYSVQDYNDIPLTPPTPQPAQRRPQRPRARLSDTFRNGGYRNDARYYEDEQKTYIPNRNRGSGYPLALGSTATTTTHRPYDDINEISSDELSVDTLDLNISPYMKAPQQTYNPYPTLSNNSPSSSIASTLPESSENDLLSSTENTRKRKTNKRRKINKSRRRKVKRRPNQKKVVIKKETPVRSNYAEPTQDPRETLERLKQERVSSQDSRRYNEDDSRRYNEDTSSRGSIGSFMGSFEGGDNNGPTLNNPFGANSFPTPTASWTQLSPSSDEPKYSDDRRYNDSGDRQGSSSGSGYNPFEPQGFDPFEQMAKDFDGGSDEWISTISQAFEGFSDFKKIDGGQQPDL